MVLLDVADSSKVTVPAKYASAFRSMIDKSSRYTITRTIPTGGPSVVFVVGGLSGKNVEYIDFDISSQRAQEIQHQVATQQPEPEVYEVMTPQGGVSTTTPEAYEQQANPLAGLGVTPGQTGQISPESGIEIFEQRVEQQRQADLQQAQLMGNQLDMPLRSVGVTQETVRTTAQPKDIFFKSGEELGITAVNTTIDDRFGRNFLGGQFKQTELADLGAYEYFLSPTTTVFSTGLETIGGAGRSVGGDILGQLSSGTAGGAVFAAAPELGLVMLGETIFKESVREFVSPSPIIPNISSEQIGTIRTGYFAGERMPSSKAVRLDPIGRITVGIAEAFQEKPIETALIFGIAAAPSIKYSISKIGKTTSKSIGLDAPIPEEIISRPGLSFENIILKEVPPEISAVTKELYTGQAKVSGKIGAASEPKLSFKLSTKELIVTEGSNLGELGVKILANTEREISGLGKRAYREIGTQSVVKDIGDSMFKIETKGGAVQSRFPEGYQSTLTGGRVLDVETIKSMGIYRSITGESMFDITIPEIPAQLRAGSVDMIGLSRQSMSKGLASLKAKPEPMFEVMGGRLVRNGRGTMLGLDVYQRALPNKIVVTKGYPIFNLEQRLGRFEFRSPSLSSSMTRGFRGRMEVSERTVLRSIFGENKAVNEFLKLGKETRPQTLERFLKPKRDLALEIYQNRIESEAALFNFLERGPRAIKPSPKSKLLDVNLRGLDMFEKELKPSKVSIRKAEVAAKAALEQSIGMDFPALRLPKPSPKGRLFPTRFEGIKSPFSGTVGRSVVGLAGVLYGRRTSTKTRPKPISSQKINLKKYTEPTNIFDIGVTESVTQEQSISLIPAQRQNQTPSQALKTFSSLETVPPEFVFDFPITDFPRESTTTQTTIPVPLFSLPTTVKRKTKPLAKQPGYSADILSRGRWMNVAKDVPLGNALSSGAYIVDNYPSARFRIRKSKKEVTPTIESGIEWNAIKNKFKKSNKKNEYIEKTGFRIDSMNEVLGIPYRGQAAQKAGVRRKKRRRR